LFLFVTCFGWHFNAIAAAAAAGGGGGIHFSIQPIFFRIYHIFSRKLEEGIKKRQDL
jgi:hypothetical protein